MYAQKLKKTEKKPIKLIIVQYCCTSSFFTFYFNNKINDSRKKNNRILKSITNISNANFMCMFAY